MSYWSILILQRLEKTWTWTQNFITGQVCLKLSIGSDFSRNTMSVNLVNCYGGSEKSHFVWKGIVTQVVTYLSVLCSIMLFINNVPEPEKTASWLRLSGHKIWNYRRIMILPTHFWIYLLHISAIHVVHAKYPKIWYS